MTNIYDKNQFKIFTAVNKAIVNSRLCPWCTAHSKYF